MISYWNKEGFNWWFVVVVIVVYHRCRPMIVKSVFVVISSLLSLDIPYVLRMFVLTFVCSYFFPSINEMNLTDANANYSSNRLVGIDLFYCLSPPLDIILCWRVDTVRCFLGNKNRRWRKRPQMLAESFLSISLQILLFRFWVEQMLMWMWMWMWMWMKMKIKR